MTSDDLLRSLAWLPVELKQLLIIALHEAFVNGYRAGQSEKERK